MANLRKTYEKVYKKEVDKIYRFVFIKVNSQEIAEDLTSEVFTRGWDTFQKKGKEIDNPRAFLYQIARNLIVDHYREAGQARLVSIDSRGLIDPSQDLIKKASISSDMDRVRVCLADLKDEYREIIVWYYLDELSVPEIAKMTDKSKEAVRVTIHRALKALKQELQ